MTGQKGIEVWGRGIGSRERTLVQGKVIYDEEISDFFVHYKECSFRVDELDVLSRNCIFENCNFNCSKVKLLHEGNV